MRVVRLAANVGLGQVRDAGLDHARGGYVWLVDGDDWLPAGAVRTVLDRLAGHRPEQHRLVGLGAYRTYATLRRVAMGLVAATDVGEKRV